MLRVALRRAQPLVGRWPGRTWILCYHLIGAGTGLPIDLPREVFREHLDALSSRARVVGLPELVRELRAGAPDGPSSDEPDADAEAAPGMAATRPRVVLTFDDAFANFHEVALPMLAKGELPAILYVIPGFVNGDGNHPLYDARFAHLRPMGWEHLREAADAGVEIGSHTYRHTNLARLRELELADEFRRAREEIEQRLEVRAASVCYPEGFVTKAVTRMAGRFHESGVVAGGRPVRVACGGGLTRGEDLLRLPRLPVRADQSAEALLEVLDQSRYLEEWAADRLGVSGAGS